MSICISIINDLDILPIYGTKFALISKEPGESAYQVSPSRITAMKKSTLGAIALAASTVIGSAPSHADLVGQLWLNETAVATNLALFPAGLLSGIDATFTS